MYQTVSQEIENLEYNVRTVISAKPAGRGFEQYLMQMGLDFLPASYESHGSNENLHGLSDQEAQLSFLLPESSSGEEM